MTDAIVKATAHRARRLAIVLGAGYAVLGMVWILVSDALVASLFPDPRMLLVAQRDKGLFYVLVTAGGLAALVYWGCLRMLRADAAAKAQELQVHDLFLRHPKPMWVYDPATLGFLQVNDAAISFYGYSREEFLAMTLMDIRPEDDKPRFAVLSQQPIVGFRDIGRARHRKKSREVVYMHVTAHEVPYGGRMAVMVMALDITQDVRTQDALQRQEAEFRQLHQSLSSVLWLARADSGRFVYVSPACEAVYGRPADELMQSPRTWLDCVVEEDRALASGTLNALRDAGHAQAQYRIRRPDGSMRWVHDRKRVISNDEGGPTLVGGIVEDITAQKELEAARATTQEQLERMVEQRTAELEQVNAELEAFTRTAAHDLRSPLASINGLMQLLLHKHGEALGVAGRELVVHAEASSRHMTQLVSDLLMLSRVAHHELQVQDVDLVPIAAELLAELRRQEPQRSVEVELPPEARAVCDPGLVRSLLSNLLGNAWKYTRDQLRATIRMTARESEAGWAVCIEDNGIGFDATSTDRLFRPFQRFHASSQFEGTGIGLVTCQRIVERHGGRIVVTSQPGHGTAVTFTLPQHRDAAAAAAPAGQALHR
jgi:PAS domain S-box-containing protein